MPNGKDGPGTTPGQCVLPGPWVSAGMGLGCRAEPVARFPVFQQAPSGREAVLQQDPFSGPLFVFRGRPGDLVKVIWWDGQGACMFLKRLEKGRFVWLSAKQGKVALPPAQLAMLLEGIDWRAPLRRWRPLAAG